MPTDNSTVNVTATRSGTGWTMNTTTLNLSVDTTVKDFRVYLGAVDLGVANFTKNSANQITYNGTGISSGLVTVRRYTQIQRVTEPLYRSTISVNDYNTEINRLHKIVTELRLNGTGETVTNTSNLTLTGINSFVGGSAIFSGGNTTTYDTGTTLTLLSGATLNSAATNNITGNLNISSPLMSITTPIPSFAVSGLEFGKQTGGDTVTFLDFHNGFASDYSARISVTGGSTATGSASFNVEGAGLNFNIPVGGVTMSNKPNQLTASGGEVVTADWVRQAIRPYVNVSQGSGQVISHNTQTNITLATETSDADNAFASSTFTVLSGGVYAIDGMVSFTTGCIAILLSLFVNGGAYPYFAQNGAETGGAADICVRASGTTILPFNTNDTIQLRVIILTNGGTTRTISSASFRAAKLGEAT